MLIKLASGLMIVVLVGTGIGHIGESFGLPIFVLIPWAALTGVYLSGVLPNPFHRFRY